MKKLESKPKHSTENLEETGETKICQRLNEKKIKIQNYSSRNLKNKMRYKSNRTAIKSMDDLVILEEEHLLMNPKEDKIVIENQSVDEEESVITEVPTLKGVKKTMQRNEWN